MDINDIGVPSNSGFDPEFAAAADWARLYRSAGVQIVPCKNKVPRLKSWKEYQHALVPDAQFEAWYGHNGEFAQSYDMGALTGLASGRMLMIDLDIYKVGAHAAVAWWNGILAVHNNGMHLETWEQMTGGGGRQLFFTYPPNWRSAVNAKTDINVDIRCQGGFAVLPPTLHASGKNYTWIEGRAPWEIDIALAPDWLLEEVEKLIREHGGGSPANVNEKQSTKNSELPFVAAGQTGNVSPLSANIPGTYDAFGHLIDGREDKMYKQIWAALVGLRIDSPISPGMREEEAIWGEYERNTDVQVPQDGETKLQGLEREKRGPTEFHKKWLTTLKKWDTEIAEAAKVRQAKERNHNLPGVATSFDHTQPGDIFPFLDVDQIMDKPDPVWVIDGIINERALGFIFGPPSSLKTFIALDLALSMAARLPTWWNRGINRHGAVVYLCREGTSSFKKRIQAWEIHRKCAARGQPFYLIEHPCNFMDAADVGKAVATIKAIMAVAGVPVAAVMVDTVSRVLPGAEENLQKDMTLFVRACELIQLEFQCIVIGVHHTNKNGGIRGSSVIPGAGDFLLETRRETGMEAGVMVLQKVKDGEDGIELPFKMTRVDLPGIVARQSLVVDPEGDAKPAGAASAAGTDGLPDRTVCLEILAALDVAWLNKVPWCRAANGQRPAIDMIMGRWQLQREPVKRLLSLWLANGVIEIEVYDKKNKVSGYRKISNL